MLKYAVLILWRKKGVPANFYAFCISGPNTLSNCVGKLDLKIQDIVKIHKSHAKHAETVLNTDLGVSCTNVEYE